MKREIYRDVGADGIVARTFYDDVTHEVTVSRSQDVQSAVDMVQAVNADGGVRSQDGLGLPVAEVPVIVAMEWAEKRGIPWEKLLYTNEYDDQFKRFCREHSKLQYQNARRLVPVK